MIKDKISVKNASENNLKNISVDIPKEKLVVITGVSGSGKSSLAFDVIYNEGRRRYVDSLSNYAKQFLGGTTKPKVDSIEGLSPAIAIDQKTTSNNPRSTVGTITEIWDFYRILFSRIGKPFCPVHNIEISSQTVTQIIDKVYSENKFNSNIQILAPIIEEQKGTHVDLFEELKRKGFLRVKVNGKIFKLDEKITLDKNKKHTISIVVDRMKLEKDSRSRLFEAVQVGSDYAKGLILIENIDTKKIELFSRNFSCKHGDFDMPKINSRLFSFNSPIGACQKCNGLGHIQKVTWESVINENLSIFEGGIKYFGLNNQQGMEFQIFSTLLNHYKIDPNKKLSKMTKKERDIILNGSDEDIDIRVASKSLTYSKTERIEGVAELIERRHLETASDLAREHYSKFLQTSICDVCHGDRLNSKALAVKINKVTISQLANMPIEDQLKFINNIELTKQEKEIVDLALMEIKSRFKFLINVGLGYLSLTRIAHTLSGGESQRIRLASQLGSRLTGIVYVLDEPSIGLHQRDNTKLIQSLKEIRDLGNTVLVVEHDEETMLDSDWIIDVGPKAGKFGGEIVAQGTPEQVATKNTLTGRYLSGKDVIEVPKERRKGNGKSITIFGAKENNLKNIDVTLPLGKFIAVTGVSGSGKSTLINEILYKGIKENLGWDGQYEKPGMHDSIEGLSNIDKVVRISQEPIGKTPRSNPATYTSVFDDIRDIFTTTTEAKLKGFEKGRFSFNVKGGRCEKCQGDGVIKISMQFLPDVYVKCDECNGKRYNEETLLIKYKDKTIADVLDMSIDIAFDFFENVPKIKHKLQFLKDVGLGYIQLGHNATLLSGGEAQRVKLATYLQKKPTGKTVYILDEPTTGLHHYDISVLLKVLNRIVDKGDTVLVIEHNLDVIKIADYVIDLGPEGGAGGGELIGKGTPEDIARNSKSYTGKYLKPLLSKKYFR